MMKVPDHYFTQSAVIPYRHTERGLEVLLITSRKRKRWLVPKGVKEPDLSPAQSAVAEALEEAGVEGRVSSSPLGAYKYRKWGGVCDVAVYTLEVTKTHDEWPECDRDREWVSPEEAARRVEQNDLRRLIRLVQDSVG